jgi:hypothetical protein
VIIEAEVMGRSEVKLRRSASVISMALACFAGRASGDDRWIGGAGDWFDPTHWTNGGPPTITSFGAQEGIPAGLGPAQLSSGTAVVGNFGVQGTLAISGGELAAVPFVAGDLSIDGSLSVGASGTVLGVIVQTGGAVYPDNYAGSGFEADGLGYGLLIDGNGTYDLENGTIVANAEKLGFGGGPPTGNTATFIQNGGVNSVPGVPTIAFGDSPTGGLVVGYANQTALSVYSLNAGTLSANTEIIGGGGTGSLVQTGGTNNVTGTATYATFNNNFNPPGDSSSVAIQAMGTDPGATRSPAAPFLPTSRSSEMTEPTVHSPNPVEPTSLRALIPMDFYSSAAHPRWVCQQLPMEHIFCPAARSRREKRILVT